MVTFADSSSLYLFYGKHTVIFYGHGGGEESQLLAAAGSSCCCCELMLAAMDVACFFPIF